MSSVKRIQLAGASVSLSLHRDANRLTVVIDNAASPSSLNSLPTFLLSHGLARSVQSSNHRRQSGDLSAADQRNGHRRRSARKSEVQLDWSGGISIIQDVPALQLGDPSAGVHIVDVHCEGRRSQSPPMFPRIAHRNCTSRPIGNHHVDGATVRPRVDGLVELTFAATQGASSPYAEPT